MPRVEGLIVGADFDGDAPTPQRTVTQQLLGWENEDDARRDYPCALSDAMWEVIAASRRPSTESWNGAESLTPSCRVVLEAIGFAWKADEHGFVIKHGGAFRWDDEKWVFDWGKQVGSRSWQVDRSEFDALLLEHARQNGVRVTTGVSAGSVRFDGDRPVAVVCRPDDSAAYVIDDFDFLIDATGRYGLLSSRHFGDRRPLQNLRNVAIWSYWNGAAVLPDTPTGGINIISSSEGWYWGIPLAGGRMSIGYVTTKDAFARDSAQHPSNDDLYRHLVAASSTVAELTADAVFLGATRVETDYSYIADHFCGCGYVIVGDAACFLDPLLSTGAATAARGRPGVAPQ